MKDILYLVHRIPYPPNKGDKIRSYNILKYLASRYRVHLAAFIDDPDDFRHIATLQDICESTCFVKMNAFESKLHSLKGLFNNQPLTIPYYSNKKIQVWVNNVINEKNIKRIFVFSSAMAQYVAGESLSHIRRVIDFVDIDSDKWRQYSASHNWPLSWVYKRESELLLAYERKMSLDFDKSIFVSKEEADLYKKLVPDVSERVTQISNGVDTDYFTPEHDYSNPYTNNENVIVFTGAMDYWANIDAVIWFADKVLPIIQESIEGVKFYIVGSKPNEKVRELGKNPGINVTGAVYDIRPYIKHAKIAVAPMRIARGIQNKVLEAMAMAIPVVATSAAMDGITSSVGAAKYVTDDPALMARYVIELLGVGNDKIGRLGRQSVLEYYNWDNNLARIHSLLEGRDDEGGA